MHYLYRFTTLQRDTGNKKSFDLTDLVMLQPQRPNKRLKISWLNSNEERALNQLVFVRFYWLVICLYLH